jgi:hypothetical protein
MVLWKAENYLDVFDHAAQVIHDNVDDTYWFHTSTHLETLLAHEVKGEDIIPRQDEWLTHYISNHAEDEQRMYSLFSTIAAFPPERRKAHILHFVSVNSSYDAFEKIHLEESSWGGMGSMIPCMEARISFLESLLPHFNGVMYLHHKQKIIKDIECWYKKKKKEQIDEMLRG